MYFARTFWNGGIKCLGYWVVSAGSQYEGPFENRGAIHEDLMER